MHTHERCATPPFEGRSLFIEITRGCPQEKPCKFCALFQPTYASIDREIFEHELDQINEVYMYPPERVFLASGNPFSLEEEKLLYYVETIAEKLKSVQSIGGFARVSDIKALSNDGLKRLAAAGVSRLSLGADSGDDETLAMVNRDHTAQDIIEQCARLDDAGITYYLYYMPGLAGEGKCIKNGEETGKVFSQCHPERIYVISAAIYPHSVLGYDEKNGLYKRASEMEILNEIHTMLKTTKCKTVLDVTNEANCMLFKADLPATDYTIDQFRGMLDGLNVERVEQYHRLPEMWFEHEYNFFEDGFTRSGMI